MLLIVYESTAAFFCDIHNEINQPPHLMLLGFASSSWWKHFSSAQEVSFLFINLSILKINLIAKAFLFLITSRASLPSYICLAHRLPTLCLFQMSRIACSSTCTGHVLSLTRWGPPQWRHFAALSRQLSAATVVSTAFSRGDVASGFAMSIWQFARWSSLSV